MRGDQCHTPGHGYQVKRYFCLRCRSFLCPSCVHEHDPMHPIVPFHCPRFIFNEYQDNALPREQLHITQQFTYPLQDDGSLFYAFYCPYSLYLYNIRSGVPFWHYYGAEISVVLSSAARFQSLLVFTGGISAFAGQRESNIAYAVDATQCTKAAFRQLAPMISPRLGHDLLFLNGGLLLCTGGSIHNASLATCEMYQVSNDRWLSFKEMCVARCYHGMCLFNSRYVYVFGGDKLPLQDGTIETADFLDLEAGWLPRTSVQCPLAADILRA